MLKFLVSPGELVLKGRNRGFFERQLDRNLRLALGKSLYRQDRFGSRRLLQVDGKIEEAQSRLRSVFGISRFASVNKADNWDDLKKQLKNILQEKSFRTFAIRAKNKDTKGLSGQKMNERLGNFIGKDFPVKVDLEKPELTIYVDHYPHAFYFHFGWQQGAGGLPVGISGQVLSLFSGGIDSPVAAYLMARRGCRVDLLHFYALDNAESVLASKIKPLFHLLQRYTVSSQLILLPYAPFYQAIRQRPPTGNEVVLFRRFILRAGERLAVKNGYRALVTGDNLSQVASQTLANIVATTETVKMPVFRPLIGFDKKEIIDWARRIGSYELSIRPYQDCCALVQKHAKTRVNLAAITKEEKQLKLEKALTSTLEKTVVVSGN